MSASPAAKSWTLTMNAGSLQEFEFAFTAPSGGPYDITAATWEFVARTSVTDLTVPPLIDITTTTTTPGVITPDVPAGTVALTITPAATAGIAPGSYVLALWMSPGTTSAFCWINGSLVIQGTPQP